MVLCHLDVYISGTMMTFTDCLLVLSKCSQVVIVAQCEIAERSGHVSESMEETSSAEHDQPKSIQISS